MGDTPEADVEGARAAGHPPGADGARRRRDGADAVHSLDELIPLALRPDDAALRCRVHASAARRSPFPFWVPFRSPLAAVLFIVSIFGLAVYGIIAVGDPWIETADDMPLVATQALTFLQDVLVFVAWIAVRLSIGETPRERFGLVRDPGLH